MKLTLKLVAASTVIPFACVQAQNTMQHPNVLMLVVDDWGLTTFLLPVLNYMKQRI